MMLHFNQITYKTFTALQSCESMNLLYFARKLSKLVTIMICVDRK